jgi:arylsulfatase A-like enzyme
MVSLAASLALFAGQLAASPPNIILISVDGMGQADLSAYGGEWITTSALDQLAAGGVRAEFAYAAGPAAAASRYGLLTGARPQRFGIQSDADASALSPGDRVPESHPVLPEILRRNGYTTVVVGKWNYRTDPLVWSDHVYSPIDWDADYFPGRDGRYPGVWPDTHYDKAGIDYGWGPVREGDEYLTDRLGREAREFIADHAAGPFFLYLAFNAPGRPLQAKAQHRDAVAHLPSEALRIHAAMLLSVDENIGLLLDQLDQLGIAADTLVVFVGDHGPSFGFDPGWPTHWERETLGSTGGLRGHKGGFEEGGLRVPFIMRWPAGITGPMVYDAAVSSLDIYPTLCAAAGIEIPADMAIDGRDLLPYLDGALAGVPHEELFWMENGRGALLLNGWKLIVDNDAQSAVRLYDLVEDPFEAADLAAADSARRGQMLARWREIAHAMPLSYLDLEDYFRQIDIARRADPVVFHELVAQQRVAAILEQLNRVSPGAEHLGDDLYFSPSIGYFQTGHKRFPLLVHLQWGYLFFSQDPLEPFSRPVYYSMASHPASAGRLGWLIQLTDTGMLFHAPALGGFAYIPQLPVAELWLYDYQSEQWDLYETTGVPDTTPDDPDDPDDPDPGEPSLENYQALIANPPDGGAGPLLWFTSAREPNHGSAGAWTIAAAAPLTDVRGDFFGNPEGAFGLAAGSTGGAAISGSGGTPYAAGDAGTFLLSFHSGSDVQTLASLFSKGMYSNDDPFEVTLLQGSLRLNYRRDAASKASAILIELNPDTWYTIAVSWDLSPGGNSLFWKVVGMGQGPLASGAFSASVVGTLDAPIRVSGRNAMNPFFGSLQDLAIFGRCLDDETIDALLSALY